jgi:hypothetical protein
VAVDRICNESWESRLRPGRRAKTEHAARTGLPRVVAVTARAGAHLMRHASLYVFALIAVALLTGAARGSPGRVGGPAILAAVGDAPAASIVWLEPQILAGMAALVVALADAGCKVIRAVRQDGSVAVCPFAKDGVARCHGASAPVPPEVK